MRNLEDAARITQNAASLCGILHDANAKVKRRISHGTLAVDDLLDAAMDLGLCAVMIQSCVNELDDIVVAHGGEESTNYVDEIATDCGICLE